jgi:predicted esterase
LARSQLVYRAAPPTAAARATLVVLHGRNSRLDQLFPLAQRLGPDLTIVAPEAARGVYVDRELVSYTWFGIQELPYPEPASFGDSLYQLEQFVYDVRARQLHEEPPPYVLGYDLGAVLALTLTGVIPDFLSGVVAVCGYLPIIPGWTPPMERLEGLPVLLVSDPGDPSTPTELVAATAAQLRGRGADLTLESLRGAGKLGNELEDVLRSWFDAQLPQEA